MTVLRSRCLFPKPLAIFAQTHSAGQGICSLRRRCAFTRMLIRRGVEKQFEEGEPVEAATGEDISAAPPVPENKPLLWMIPETT